MSTQWRTLEIVLEGKEDRSRVPIEETSEFLSRLQTLINHLGDYLTGSDYRSRGRSPDSVRTRCTLVFKNLRVGSLKAELELQDQQTTLENVPTLGEESIKKFYDLIAIIEKGADIENHIDTMIERPLHRNRIIEDMYKIWPEEHGAYRAKVRIEDKAMVEMPPERKLTLEGLLARVDTKQTTVTDVLSAGQNLQNAQYVANYDFPWNPVVLIQRIGRIDRMGSDHKKVYVINVLPKNGDPEDSKSIEHFLGLMKKLYQRLEAIRQTIGIDATTLGEKAEPKDFGIQEAIAKNDPTILDKIARDLEQFTSDPKDTLAKIINDKGYAWLESLPKGIGAIKKSLNRDGLFILFSDGNDFHWRLKYYDQKKELVTSPTDIVDTVMEGDIQNSGESIDYASLVGRMRDMKEELKQQLEVQVNRERALAGVPPRPTQVIRDIYNELANSGTADGEELAALFRDQSNRQAIVTTLQNARKVGQLLDKAREILKQSPTPEEDEHFVANEVRLTRVCWCWIQPS